MCVCVCVRACSTYIQLSLSESVSVVRLCNVTATVGSKVTPVSHSWMCVAQRIRAQMVALSRIEPIRGSFTWWPCPQYSWVCEHPVLFVLLQLPPTFVCVCVHPWVSMGIQWNLSIADTIGTQLSVLYREVSLIQR